MLQDTEVTADTAIEQPSEKMIPQSHVDAIVKREKAKVAEHLAKEFESRQAQSQTQPLSQGQGQAQQFDTAEIERRVMEQMEQKHKQQLAQQEQQQHEQTMNEIAQQYYLKMGKGKESYSDFDEIMADFEPAAFPSTVFLASEMENTPHIMYELSKNPTKLQAIESLAKSSPIMARKQLKLLADSIDKNTTAQANHISTTPPLSRAKSSPGAGTASGKQNFKGASWLKG